MDKIISTAKGSVKNWWIFLIIGVLLLGGAIYMFSKPLESLIGLTGFFSFLILASGILAIIFAIVNKEDIDNWGLHLAGGILDILIGFILLKYPQISVVLISLFVGFWLMFRGVNTISTAFKLKKEGADNWIWILIMGIIISFFAFLSIINPLVGASYLVYTLALSILFLGIANIFIALKLKNVKGNFKDFRENIAERIEDKLED
jgi:uncharacterized membrane protein HdeD (DUF308 family)